MPNLNIAKLIFEIIFNSYVENIKKEIIEELINFPRYHI